MPDYAIGTLHGSYQRIQYGYFSGTYDTASLVDTPANVSEFTIVNPNDFHGWLQAGYSYYRFYFPCTAGTPVVAHLAPSTHLEVKVASGGRAVVADLFSRGNITKTGTGVLEIDSTRTGRNRVFVKEGALAFGGARANLESVLAKASFHIDASDAASMTLGRDADGRTTVERWNDVRGNGEYARPIVKSDVVSDNAVYLQNPRAPYISEAKSTTGLPLVDFGATPNDDPALGPTGCGMRLSSQFQAKEVVYVIARPDNQNQSFAMGDTANYYFHPGGYALFLTASGYPLSTIAEKYCFVNGSPFPFGGDCRSIQTSLHTVDVALGSAAPVSLLACDRFIAANTGGMRMAEVLFFEDMLTDDERTVLENYLHRKWHENVDKGGVSPDAVVDAVRLASGTSIEVAAGVTARVNYVITDSSTGLVKTGAGTLEVGAIVDDNGKPLRINPDVRGGSVATGRLLSIGPSAAADPYIWLDSSTGVEQSGDVARWSDKRDNGRYAYTPETIANKPQYVASALAGRPAVDFGIARGQGGTYMKFNVDGSNAYAAFMVVRPNQKDTSYGYNDRPPLFGDSQFQLFRFRNASVLSRYYYNCLGEAAGWNVNGSAVSPAVNLSWFEQTDEFFLVSFSSGTSIVVDRLFSERDNANNSGGFQICEFISYDRKLSADEVASTEAYLMNRWFAKAHPLAVVGSVDFAANEPVTVDSDGYATYDRVYGGNGSLVKTGAGVADVTGSIDDFTNITVNGVLNLRDSLPDRGAVIHFDAADTAGMELSGGNVLTWQDVRRSGPLATSLWTVQGETCPGDAYAHAHPITDTVDIGGVLRPAVKLGTMKSSDAAGFQLSATFEGIDFYTVFNEPNYTGDDAGRGMIVGCGSDIAFWNRGYNREILGGYLIGSKILPSLIEVDGVEYTKNQRAPNGTHLFSFTMEALAKVPYIGSDRHNCGTGGGAMFEQVVFASALEPSARARVQDYLTAKWFGAANGANSTADKVFVFNFDADGNLGRLEFDGFLDGSDGIHFRFTAEKGALIENEVKMPFLKVSDFRGYDPAKMSFDVSAVRKNGRRCRNRIYTVSLEGDTFFLTVERTGTVLTIN
ncbi:MAG: hypothetical protein IJG13_09665 [Kiritimatiellae bacterium]|nr:hypothetical protein [Kiritimatiellia bacterium]